MPTNSRRSRLSTGIAFLSAGMFFTQSLPGSAIAAVDPNPMNSGVNDIEKQSLSDLDKQKRDIVNTPIDFCDPAAVDAQQRAVWHVLYLKHNQERAHPTVRQAADRAAESLADEGYFTGDLPYLPEYRDAIKRGDVAAQESLLRKMTPAAQAQAAEERKDFLTELKILTPLADSGDVQAQARVAGLYAYNKVDLAGPTLQRPKNEALALKYYRMAAANGDAHSQENLANAYACGDFGVRRDLVRAYAWFSLAVSQSAVSLETDERPEEILVKRNFIAGEMSRKDVQRAKHLLIQCDKSGFKNCD